MLRSLVPSQTVYARALLTQPSLSVPVRTMSTSTPPTLSPLVHHLRPGPPAADAQTTAHRLLLANHSDYDIFEANQIFHNHLSARLTRCLWLLECFADPPFDSARRHSLALALQHHVLTAFALGAPPSLLEEIFQHEKETLVSLDPAERKAQLEKKGKKVRTDVPGLDSTNWTEFAGVQEYVPFSSDNDPSTALADLG